MTTPTANAPATQARATLLVIYTPALQSCREFYSALGIQFVPEQHGQGPLHYAAVMPDGMVLELYPATARRPVSTLRLGLAVAGAELDPPLPAGHHVLRDPDGRVVEVHAC